MQIQKVYNATLSAPPLPGIILLEIDLGFGCRTTAEVIFPGIGLDQVAKWAVGQRFRVVSMRDRFKPSDPWILSLADPDLTPYWYGAKFRSAYDATTVDLDIEVEAFHAFKDLRFSLSGCLGNQWGLGAKEAFVRLVKEEPLWVKTEKGKAGNYLVHIWFQGSADEWIDVNQWLIDEGHAASRA